jgi:type III pantothenate kinase
MQLLLDIGNSSVNWALQDQGVFVSDGAFRYKKNNVEHALQNNFLFSVIPTDVFVSNVAGIEVYNALQVWIKKQWQQECWQPTVLTSFNELKNSYSDVQQMGIDRWLSMVASWEEYHSALCLVGCGTALTIDIIDDEGKHLGGYIAPGVELMQQSLVKNTEQINIDIETQASLEYARDTRTAVNNGAFLAAVSMIDRVTDKFSNESKCAPKCIISGGMAELIKPLLGFPFEHKPNLVLTGLSLLQKDYQ